MATAHQRALENDQLGFFLFLALALHTLLILGVGFAGEEEGYAVAQLEVTLTQQRRDRAPEDATFIAQANQSGSGTESQRVEITTREIRAAPLSTPPKSREQPRVTTAAHTRDRVLRQPQTATPEPARWRAGSDPRLRHLSDSIASLEARLDRQQQEYAQRPKTHRLASPSARQSVEAAYLYHWRTRVEEIGNRHYPPVSSRDGIYGDLRLRVAIRHDGSIEAIKILASSGHEVLDEAAVRIVRMAAPFAVFPPQLRDKTDRLDIIRIWKFKQNRLSSEQG